MSYFKAKNAPNSTESLSLVVSEIFSGECDEMVDNDMTLNNL